MDRTLLSRGAFDFDTVRGGGVTGLYRWGEPVETPSDGKEGVACVPVDVFADRSPVPAASSFSFRSFSSARSFELPVNEAAAFSTSPRSRSRERLRDFLRLFGVAIRLASRSRSKGSVMISVSRSVARLLDRRAGRLPLEPPAVGEPLANVLWRRGDASRVGRLDRLKRGDGLALVEGDGEVAAEDERLVITGLFSLP